MLKPIEHRIEIGDGKEIHLETGLLAKQADGAVIVRQGDTMVLCTVVMADSAREGQSFFPLSVEYKERLTAGGRIPGGFIKREGRPSDREILSCRLVDRSIRPLFADGLFNEVQVICNVISSDGQNHSDVLAGIGTSAAISIAGLPFHGPIAMVRVGRVDGAWVINPTVDELEASDLDLVVAGHMEAIVMVEGEMKEVDEAEMLEALEFAHTAIQSLCKVQQELVAQVNPTPRTFTPVVLDQSIVAQVNALIGTEMAAHVRAPYDKATFYGGVDQLTDKALDALLGSAGSEQGRNAHTEDGFSAGDIKDAVAEVERNAMREMILDESRRIDGRSLTEIRPIWMKVGLLPRVHGSSVFTRGETQVMASVTLGTARDAQDVDQLFETKKNDSSCTTSFHHSVLVKLAPFVERADGKSVTVCWLSARLQA